MKLYQEQIRKSISEMTGASKEGRKADWFDVMELIGQQQQEIERYEKALADIRNVSTLDEYEGANPNSLLSACYQIAKEASVKTQ